jgi:lipoate---protein ligase
MHRLDLTSPTPAQLLAADEALLDWCEAGHGGEMLLFWEPRETFVVVGYANKVSTEVNLAACQEMDVPVFRRCSGGGTVIQMPGGLNYSLILRVDDNLPTRNISSTNNFIMDQNRIAVQAALGPGAGTIAVHGHTDLAIAPPGSTPGAFRKFAGNSQRRRKHFLLFHGTLLLNCDLKQISRLLQMPSLQPDYRVSRSHEEFLTNLNLPAATVKAALTQAWQADAQLDDLPLDDIKKLAREKYSSQDWNYKF